MLDTNRIYLGAISFVATILLVMACSEQKVSENRRLPANAQNQSGDVESEALHTPSPQDLDGLDAKAALPLANEWGKQWSDVVTSYVDQHGIVFEFDDGNEYQVNLPSNQRVIAIAPYIGRTHPCEIHYMSGCQGELVEKPLHVEAVSAEGDVLVNRTIKTAKNGFFELWLPRDIEIELQIEAFGKKAVGKISTYGDSTTCITTFQLL